MYRYLVLLLIAVSFFIYGMVPIKKKDAQIIKSNAVTIDLDNTSIQKYEIPMSITKSSIGTPLKLIQNTNTTPAKAASIKNNSELLNEVNTWRISHSLPIIKESHQICEFTNYRISELIAQGSLDNHSGFNNYINSHSLGSMELSGIAENLAIGTNSATEIVKMWENSPPHREQLLANNKITRGCAAVNNKIAVLIGGY